MCNFKSAIVLKDKIYCPLNTDKHEDMIEALELDDDSITPDFVRVEMIPIDGDIFNHNMGNWKLKVDQDLIPDWFDFEETKKGMESEMLVVFEKCFAINVKNKEYSNIKLWVKNSKGIILRNSSAVLRENSSAELRENSSAELRENSSAVLRENSSAELRENSSAELWGNSSAELRENSSAVIPYSKNIKINGVHDNATIKDLSANPKLIIANDFEIVKFNNKK